ncbi:MAG: restriction endonuclease subunit S [Methylobacter sp.]|nr:restriction endonuclease subunit S [Methylobacter sp.]
MKQGWGIKRLCEVALVSSGNSAPQKKELFENGIYPFIRTSDIGQIKKGFIRTCADYLNKDGIKGLKLYKKGTILFPKSGASTFLNHRVMMEIDSYVSSHLATIKADNSIADDRFILYFLTTIDARDLMQDIAYPSLKISDIGLIEIPLPPLPEQQRIVAILDESFAAIAKAKSNAEQNLKNAKELFESYLQNVFENKGDSWEEKTLGEIAAFRNGMNFTKSSKGEKIKIVGVKNFQNSFWVPFETLETAILDGKLNDVDLLNEGDILAVRSNGNPQLIGRTLLASEVTGKVSHSGFTIRIRLNTKNIDPIYLCNFLKITKTRKILIDGGNGVGIKSLNQGSLSALTIPFPKSLNEQQAIVQKLDALSAQTKQLEAIYQQKLTALDELKKSILNQAFSGQLS